jgi:TRAP-type mannitol/chloroaromatic compound transport system permease large subunit
VMQGVAPKGTRLGQVYAAAAPFLAIEIGIMALIVLFPWLATALPGVM